MVTVSAGATSAASTQRRAVALEGAAALELNAFVEAMFVIGDEGAAEREGGQLRCGPGWECGVMLVGGPPG